ASTQRPVSRTRGAWRRRPGSCAHGRRHNEFFGSRITVRVAASRPRDLWKRSGRRLYRAGDRPPHLGSKSPWRDKPGPTSVHGGPHSREPRIRSDRIITYFAGDRRKHSAEAVHPTPYRFFYPSATLCIP